MPSKVVPPPPPPLPVSSVRAGPHYSLLSLLALRLQSLVLPQSWPRRHALGSGLISHVHKAPVDMYCYPHAARCSLSLPSHVGDGRTLCQLAPNLGQKASMWYKAPGTLRGEYKGWFYTYSRASVSSGLSVQLLNIDMTVFSVWRDQQTRPTSRPNVGNSAR